MKKETTDIIAADSAKKSVKKIDVKYEKKEFNFIITSVVIAVISLVISFVIYMQINNVAFNELVEKWREMIDNIFAPESAYFLIFFITMLVIALVIYFWNMFVSWSDCKLQNKKFNKKTLMCEE
jgi:uncharacterized protein YacL